MPAPSNTLFSDREFNISKIDANVISTVIGNKRWNKISSIVKITGWIKIQQSVPQLPLPYLYPLPSDLINKYVPKKTRREDKIRSILEKYSGYCFRVLIITEKMYNIIIYIK